MSGSDRKNVLQAAAALIATWAFLRIIGFRRWKAAIECLTRGSALAGGTPRERETGLAGPIEAGALAAARHLPINLNCLDRSMALWWLLRSRGLAAELRLGGRKRSGRFEAHAWVEIGGARLDAAGGDRSVFVPFQRSTGLMEHRIP